MDILLYRFNILYKSIGLFNSLRYIILIIFECREYKM